MSGFSSTIFALSSGAVPSGVAVVRLSGTLVRFALETIAASVPPPRHARLSVLRDAKGRVLDRGLVLFFPGEASFTGEDVGELHLHGGRAVVAAVLDVLGELGLRQAEAGEFARRAFINGKLDLTEAEALADLIDAETETQRRLAVDNAAGAQRRLYESWRERILHARAMIEAELDFADEGDVAGALTGQVWDDIAALAEEVDRHRSRLRDGEIVRDGFRVAIVGAPNAGKSSLLNSLAERDAAIVTAIPGTTRDVIEVALDLGGVRVRLFDTAGLRDTVDPVESIGIDRARATAAEADLVLVLDDPTTTVRLDVASAGEILRVRSKADLRPDPSHPGLAISTVSGDGMEALVEGIRDRAKARVASAFDGVVPTRARHGEALLALRRALDESLADTPYMELRAEALRGAGDALGRLTGYIHTEELLGAIFSRFCIGK